MPVIAGTTVFTGTSGRMVAVDEETTDDVPAAPDVTVTFTRTRVPASAACSV